MPKSAKKTPSKAAPAAKAATKVTTALPMPLPIPYPLVPFVTLAVSGVVGYALNHFKVEGILAAQFTACPYSGVQAFGKGKALPLAAFVLCLLLLQFLAMKVNEARAKYNVEWPHMYTDGETDDAHIFNCVQRAHQHTIEQFIIVCPMLMTLSEFGFPILGGLFTILWVVTRFLYAAAYSTGNAKGRIAFGPLPHMLPHLGLMGLCSIVVLNKFGCPLGH